jgi:hypothetical protein
VFGRRQAATHGRLIRDELGESMGHFRLAAAHAANGAAGVIAPQPDAGRGGGESKSNGRMALKGSLQTVTKTTLGKKLKRKRKGGSMARRRVPMVIGGLLVAGATIGIGGTLLARRHRRRWQEYASGEPIGGENSSASATDATTAGTAMEGASG